MEDIETHIQQWEATLARLGITKPQADSMGALQVGTTNHGGHLNEETRKVVLQLQRQVDEFDSNNVKTRNVCASECKGCLFPSKSKVPQLRCYGGAHDAMNLENFLFDMEQYFKVIQPASNKLKVIISTWYLLDDAKLWWRWRYKDIQQGLCTINTWAELKELKAEVLLENIGCVEQGKLKVL